MKRISIAALLAAAIAGGPFAVSGAAAQGYDPQQRQQQQASFDDGDLKSYAEAAKSVQGIQQEYQPQMQQAPDPKAQEAVRREATQKMVEAIREEGLSVDKYNRIYAAARNDPDTARKINEFMK